MDRLLRPRHRALFSGFTEAEIGKLEKLFQEESEEEFQSKEFCQRVARSFTSSAGRAGKPIVKWTDVQKWFETRQRDGQPRVTSSTNKSKDVADLPEDCPPVKGHATSQEAKEGEKDEDLSGLEFEAKSLKDGAWYDVEMFLSHRCVNSGEDEVLVRFVGFGAEDDEWVNIKNSVRERSVPLDPSDCPKLKVGDLVLCLQERGDYAIYYDAHIVHIERKLHDVRGCRCIFLIRYNHDNCEEEVRLRRLCCRPKFYYDE